MNSVLKIEIERNPKSTIQKVVASLLMLLFYVQMWGTDQQNFPEGSELFVMANSGLSLRAEPTTSSEVLEIVEFGSSVSVLAPVDSNLITQKINWVEGQWILVDYDGIHGYMFDGYLADLPLPHYEFEKCNVDMDLIYPLESWSEINLAFKKSDTLSAGSLKKITDYYEGGDKIIKTAKNDEYKIEVFLTDVRLMDAYHLLLTMLDGKKSIESFKNASTFIEDREGELYKIIVDLDSPVRVRKLKNGDIKITIDTINYICGI